VASTPASPKLYHITHVDNLGSIVADGGLFCDVELIRRGGPTASIGMGSIKQRRLALPVKCHAGDCVGGYVPFYFCPRSIMLFLIHCANHPELIYKGGQGPILHLELDMHEVIDWANTQPRRWAFSLSNAGAVYAEFRSQVAQLDQIDWIAVAATDFRDPRVKEGKQAEFLVKDFVPWSLVRRIGAHSTSAQRRAMQAMAGATHRPAVEVLSAWYFS
jgi:ssDNA thymidine ADP-ribosyltransferase, DarT